MSNTLKHKTLFGAGPTLIGAAGYDAEHLFAGGSAGTVLTWAAGESDKVAFTASPIFGNTANRQTFIDSTLGTVAIGQPGNTTGVFCLNRAIDDSVIQYAVNVLPTWSVSGLECTGVQITTNLAPAVSKTVGAGLAVEAPTMGAGATITEWYSGIFRGAHGVTGITTAVTLSVETSGFQTLWIATNAANPTTAAEGIAFGSSRDTNLYRLATGALKTDGDLTVLGKVGVNGASNVTAALAISGTAPSSGAVSRAIYAITTFPAASTTSASVLVSAPVTEAASFTIANLYHLNINNVTIGSGSAVTIQYGLFIAPLTTGTFNITAAIGTGTTATLWIANNVDSAAATAGIVLGASKDTNLYRGGANILKTDDTMAAVLFQTTTAIVAAGGGAAPTFTTIGGTGPATAAQNGWLRMLDSAGVACWVPVWK